MLRRSTHRIRAILICLPIIASMVLTPSASAEFKDKYVPTTLPGSEILQRTKLEKDLLTGVSESVPGICSGNPDGGVLDANKLDPVPGRIGVGVTPAQLESAKVLPGQSYYYCVAAINRGPEAATFSITTVEFVGDPNPDVSRKLEIIPTTLGTWIHPVATTVEVPAGSSYEIPYAIDIPADAPEGTLSAGIRVTSVKGIGTANAAVNASVVHNIYLTLPGGTARPLKIDGVEAPSILSKRKGDLTYRAKFVLTNKGTILDSWQSKLKVSGLRRTVGEAAAGPSPIVPDQAQRVTLQWKDLPWIGWFRPDITVTTRLGEQKVDVPRVLILPPIQYVIALLLALLVPIVWIIVTWWRRRRAWMAYLDDDDDDDEIHAFDHEDDVDQNYGAPQY